MKRIITSIFSIFFFAAALNSQGIELGLNAAKNCNDHTFCTTIEVQSDSDPIYIGTSSMLLTFDERVLAFKNYISENFDGSGPCTGWSPQRFDAISRKGELEITLVLENNGNACPTIGSDPVSVGIVCFDIVQQGASPNIQYDLDHTQFNRDTPDDGTDAITISGAVSIDEINVLVCDCAGEGATCDDDNIYTVNDKFDVYCNCQGEYLDSDQDGTLDGIDACLDQTYEAEDAELFEVAIRNNVPQFSGLGFIDYLHNNNDFIEFSVNAIEDGEHVLSFRYALETGNRPLQLLIDNQEVIASLDFPATGAWADWDTLSVNHLLTAGAHTIKLMAIGSSGGNFDKLILSYCSGCAETGIACDDGNPCTTDDIIGADCNCGGKYEDTDSDGVCNVSDTCEGYDDAVDSDGDGLPDGCDNCDDNLIGTVCDDNDPCTDNDVYNVDCQCVGTFVGDDSDNDGVCDAYDVCPTGNDALDADGDGVPDACDPCDNRLVGSPCDDGDPCTLLDEVAYDCSCIGIFFDSDNDGVCTALDLCEGFDDNIDNDGDGLPDACDNNIAISEKIEIGKVNGVGDDWQTINLDNSYQSMVVVATVVLANNEQLPAVARVRNADGSSFELRIQNPSGPLTNFDLYNVEYLVIEEGIYTEEEDGFKMEARKELSTETAGSGNFVREEWDYLQTYSSPVIVGQVMTFNDDRWSHFWSSQINSGSTPADSLGFAAGKQTAQDTITDRADETIGIIVMEAGNHSLNGLRLEALVGGNTIAGVQNTSTGYVYNLGLEAAKHAVLSVSGFNGGDGGWPVLFGDEPLRGSSIFLAFDEDMILDTERSHTTEEVSYVAFEFTHVLSITAISAADAKCSGDADGSASVSILGGEEPYNYAWSNGGTSALIENLSAGTYTVTVTDDNGTTQVASATVSQPSVINANLLGNPITCNGIDDGYVLAVSFGGTGQHDYLWSNGETNAEISDLQPGVYSLTITDENGCTKTSDYEVTEPDELVVTAMGDDVDCFGGNDGTVTSSFAGGTGNSLNYLWNNGATTKDLSNIAAGEYTVTATDGNGCTATATYVVGEPALLEAATTGTFVSCNGGMDGSATASYSGGYGDATYLWSNGETTEKIENLSTGTYSVTITDENGCTATSSVNLTDPAMLAVNGTGTDVSCFGMANGEALANHTGGTGDVMYLWSTGATTASISDLVPGEYTVTTTDENGCEASTSIIIEEPTALTLPTEAEVVSCFGGSDGVASVQPSGGVGPFMALWSTGDTEMTATGLSAGTYFVTITDLNGCEGTNSVTVTQPDELLVQMTATPASCFGDSDGNILTSFTGGNDLVSYLWNTAETTADLSNLAAGEYTLTVTDQKGCTGENTVEITQPDDLQIVVDQVVAAVGSNSDGAIEISVTGGTATYSYQWFLGNVLISEEEDPSGLLAGEYTLLLTDANGCETTITIEVESVTSAEERKLAQHIYLTPNPTSGIFSLILDYPNTKETRVSIYDVAGKAIQSNIPVFEHHDFDLTEQAAGVYLLRITVGELEVTKRVVVSR